MEKGGGGGGGWSEISERTIDLKFMSCITATNDQH